MRIAFVHNGQALLPEIAAYRRFFAAGGIETSVCLYGSEPEIRADVLWYFMGLFPRAGAAGAVVIHEYTSASVPPFHSLKDLIKGRFNPSPDYRLFNNEYVMAQVKPGDGKPYGFRDMGVDIPAEKPVAEKTWDFIYSGSCSPDRKLAPLLKCFATGAVKERSLLLLGMGYEKLQQQFGTYKNISFIGPVSPEEVPVYLARSRFAINYTPDILPFRAQTSTKMLDYAAAGIPIVSNRYAWVLRFEERFGGDYYYLRPDFSNLRWNGINDFKYDWPDLRSWSWEKQIRVSGVLEFLQTRFPDIVFP